MKIQITESDVRAMAAQAITRLMDGLLFEGRPGSKESASISNAKKAIQNKIQNMLANGDETLLSVANNLGINLNYNQKDAYGIRNQAIDKQGIITNKISDDILYYANILKQYVGDHSGNIDFESMKQEHPEEFDEIMRMRDLIDQMRLTFLYDSSYITNQAKRRSLNGLYGIEIGKDGSIDTSNFGFNNISDKEIDTYRNAGKHKDLTDFEVIAAKKISLLNKYMASKYGLEVKMPSNVFSAGNTKLPKDTLIINFTSAERCPAWNECIVKHACYARNVEHMRQNVRDVNTQRSLMWQAGQNDPELMQMMFDLVKAYSIDYDKAFRNFGKDFKKQFKITSLEMLRTMNFNEMPEEVIEILKQCKKINDIRLNEDGDFVGQWLLDAWDQFAGELKMVGITSTAYTCRNLNFEKIKNIIINASKESIKGPGVARYFFAVDEDMYNAFDETYGGPDNVLEVKDGKIQINIQPLYDPKTMQANGEFYYKCPCNRVINGKAQAKDGKVQCYECRTCYEPSTLNQPYYVLVSVHGSAKNDFRNRLPSFGVSENYLANRARIDALKAPKTPKNAKKTGLVAEGEMVQQNPQQSQDDAIRQITNNAISSVREHLANI